MAPTMNPMRLADTWIYPPFHPPHWMRNPHVQTVLAAKKPRRLNYGWKSWEPMEISLGSDGNILAEASWQTGTRAQAPALILFHGMEGSAKSHYMIGLSKKAFARGFHTVRVNMRNCGRTEQMTPTLYCAGLSQDVGSVVEHLRQHMGIEAIYAIGVSLGANVVLKFLGEMGSRGNGYLRAAAALSPPIDLAAGAKRIDESGNRIYQSQFVASLIRRLRRKVELFPGIADMQRIAHIRTIYEFDDVVTAPHFGYGRADDYYRLASSGPLLRNIRVPTLIIQAMDDPMIPFEPFRRSGIEDNPALHLLATRYGGHTGFLTLRRAHRDDFDCYWAESRIVDFLTAQATQPGKVNTESSAPG
jgi:predicted alpha/beta-fold hydrolase